jgi:hypothetical protein
MASRRVAGFRLVVERRMRERDNKAAGNQLINTGAPLDMESKYSRGEIFLHATTTIGQIAALKAAASSS